MPWFRFVFDFVFVFLYENNSKKYCREMRDENIEAKFSKEKEKKVQLPVPMSLFKLFRKVIIV